MAGSDRDERRVPEGRLKPDETVIVGRSVQASLRDALPLGDSPAINCRAILESPSGT